MRHAVHARQPDRALPRERPRAARHPVRHPRPAHRPDQIELAAERGVTTFWCEQAKRTPVEELVAHIEPGEDVYITFDIDALDPSIAPGTGTPEPGGFSYYEAKAILRAVALKAHVIGMDMVEVNPLYDPMEITALHAVRLIFDAVGAAFSV